MKNKGITLIVIVIIIIVLTILAGVSIYLLLEQNEIVTREKQTVEEYGLATENKQEGLNSFLDGTSTDIGENTPQTTIQAGNEVTKPAAYTDEENVKVIADGQGNTIPVPTDFYYVGGTKDTGFVISDVENDDLDNSKGGNQFVWIPVDNVNEYVRTDFGVEDGSYSSYSETMPEDEYLSVEKYKGYYIGRYETGDKESTETPILRKEGDATTNTVTIKKGQAPYNWVTIDQAKTLAEGMKKVQSYTATTKLVSSYAWDTAINFIQKTNSDYGVSSEEDNCSNTKFTYTDINDKVQEKALGETKLIPTGQTTAVNNIYDLGGNVGEWSSESFSSTYYPCVNRGGDYDGEYTDYPAGYRCISSTAYIDDLVGFRVTLFM